MAFLTVVYIMRFLHGKKVTSAEIQQQAHKVSGFYRPWCRNITVGQCNTHDNAGWHIAAIVTKGSDEFKKKGDSQFPSFPVSRYQLRFQAAKTGVIS